MVPQVGSSVISAPDPGHGFAATPVLDDDRVADVDVAPVVIDAPVDPPAPSVASSQPRPNVATAPNTNPSPKRFISRRCSGRDGRSRRTPLHGADAAPFTVMAIEDVALTAPSSCAFTTHASSWMPSFVSEGIVSSTCAWAVVTSEREPSRSTST